MRCDDEFMQTAVQHVKDSERVWCCISANVGESIWINVNGKHYKKNLLHI